MKELKITDVFRHKFLNSDSLVFEHGGERIFAMDRFLLEIADLVRGISVRGGGEVPILNIINMVKVCADTAMKDLNCTKCKCLYETIRRLHHSISQCYDLCIFTKIASTGEFCDGLVRRFTNLSVERMDGKLLNGLKICIDNNVTYYEGKVFDVVDELTEA